MRRIKKAKVTFLSLCPRGANGLPALYKSDEPGAQLQTLVKASADFDEKGELTAIVYAPEIVDSQGDFATADAIKDMAYESARDGLDLDVRHNGKKLEKSQAFIAERFLVQKNDPRFVGMTDYAGKPVDVSGGWAVVLKIEDKQLRKEYREGGWKGVSLFAPTFEAELVKGDQNMPITKEEIAEIAKTVAETLKAATPAPAPIAKSNEAPVFAGDPTNLSDLRKHQVAVRRYTLMKSVDMNDPLAIETAILQLEKEHEERQKNESPEQKIERLVKESVQKDQEIAKLKKASTLPPTQGSTTPAPGTPQFEGLSKEESDAVQLGLGIAAAINGTPPAKK